MGAGAQNALTEAGIQFFGGVAGNTDDRVQEYLEGRLCYQPNISCSHHGGHGGSCGAHHEGSCSGHEHCHH
ncbi:MAG: NifB/NifX family molybdenum-iron cluster-binding protein [[Clostridium] leptum]